MTSETTPGDMFLFRKADRAPLEAPSRAPASMSRGKLAYEARRAAEAGMTLEAWLSKKTKDATRAAAEKLRVAQASTPKPKGFVGRLLDRAHKPLG